MHPNVILVCCALNHCLTTKHDHELAAMQDLVPQNMFPERLLRGERATVRYYDSTFGENAPTR
jgi:hypothetical protein